MADDILKDAIDMHCHPGPSLMPRDLDFVQAAEEADAAGMRAVVVKDHLMPATVTLSVLESRRDALFRTPPRVLLLGSICLNNHVGGLNPYALEIALEMGAKVVWLPTVSSGSHIAHRNQSPPTRGPFARLAALKPMTPVEVIDAEGKVLPAMIEVLELIKRYDAVMATGHLSPRETLAILPKAREAGVERIVVTHPTIDFVGCTPQEMAEMARYGVYFEHEVGFWNPVGSARQPLSTLLAMIRDFGADHTILSSDLGQLGNTHPVAGLRNVGSALADSLSSGDVDRVLRSNQAALLGL